MCPYIRHFIYISRTVFLVVRTHIQTQEQNLQIGSGQNDSFLVGMKRKNNPLSVDLYKQPGLHHKQLH